MTRSELKKIIKKKLKQGYWHHQAIDAPVKKQTDTTIAAYTQKKV